MQSSPKLPHLLTIKEVADHLQVSTKTVRRRIQAGELRSYRLGRLVRVSEEDLTLMIMRSRDSIART